METHYFECECHSDEHEFKFMLDLDEGLPVAERFPCVYLTTFMATGRFWYRVWRAIKYVFGYRCKYGHFDESIIGDAAAATRIRDLMDQYIQAMRQLDETRQKQGDACVRISS